MSQAHMKKILIIEDDQLVANIYRNKFTVENYSVETAADGESGFQTIPTFQPDVIILDLMLPKMSGLEFLTKVRAEADMKHIPVIVFSNTYLSNMVQQAWKAGATKCLSKATCTPKQVIDVVRSLSSQAPAAAETEAPAPEQTEPAEVKSASPPEDADAAFQAELRHTFLTGLPAILAGSRTQLQFIVKSADENDRLKYMEELYRRIHVLTGNAAIAGETNIAQLADALEALLKELYEKPKILNASTLRTIASALDFLGVLSDRSSKLEKPVAAKQQQRLNILVVDDEAISRRAVTYALEKAKLPSTAIEHSEAALKLLAENVYDLIFLDVDMPGMNGFEVCTKLRNFARNKTTPVVFVTSLTDFESRANSTISGGNDLIAKPFLFMELAVKALVYVQRGRLAKAAI